MTCDNSQLNIGILPSVKAVHVHGPDAEKYLQGQLTCDVQALADGESSLAAHCDPKGKVISILRLIRIDQQHFSYVQEHAIAAAQIAALKKYAVFSKLEISELEQPILAIAGNDAEAFVEQHYGAAISQHGGCADEASIFRINGPRTRFLVIEKSDFISSGTLDIKAWQQCDIASGLPHISPATQLAFIPQALNLQALDAISFSKGCYAGQETIARAKYRGANKRALFRLSGHSDQPLISGESIELQLGDNWRNKGTIIQAVGLDSSHWEALVVLPKDSQDDEVFRYHADSESRFRLSSLPYPIDE
ncbi:tRNA-modifying protein YgfZ [Alginatibacterium sediminis]|uniref:tRNA-modifying protein YgfZ n=1 Tax=Alginatibacterium sediminis TaxID=2164068 RepID=A0A420ED49_9ALTE|nr:tRNA-modifying protein YgfZ [Alginatibacterium sediminis]RKF18596.1 tRNA-modifying protein YgfZ [Alginatibacterium sediminis]